jgi:hypothetical protein
MIDAKELRVGNCVMDGAGRIMVVENIQDRSINRLIDGDGVSGSYSLEGLQPMPLTPEILEKCGFDIPAFIRDISDGFFLTTDKMLGFRLQLEKDYKHIGYVCESLKLNHIAYLHQLQNLYYALTGTEITPISNTINT